MGVTESSLSDSSQSESSQSLALSQSTIAPYNENTKMIFNQYEHRFEICTHPLYATDSNIKLLHEKLTQKSYILRILTTNDFNQKQQYLKLIDEKIALKANFLSQLESYIVDEQKSYCSEVYRYFLLFKVDNMLPLKQWLIKHIFNQKEQSEVSRVSNFGNLQYQQPLSSVSSFSRLLESSNATAIKSRFQEVNLEKNLKPNTNIERAQRSLNYEKLYDGFECLLMAISYLRYFKQPHSNINSCSVYVDPELERFVLLDPWISPFNESNSGKEGNSTSNFIQLYPSPQKINTIFNESVDFPLGGEAPKTIKSPEFNAFANDVFALGMNFMQLLVLDKDLHSEAYNFDSKTNRNKFGTQIGKSGEERFKSQAISKERFRTQNLKKIYDSVAKSINEQLKNSHSNPSKQCLSKAKLLKKLKLILFGNENDRLSLLDNIDILAKAKANFRSSQAENGGKNRKKIKRAAVILLEHQKEKERQEAQKRSQYLKSFDSQTSLASGRLSLFNKDQQHLESQISQYQMINKNSRPNISGFTGKPLGFLGQNTNKNTLMIKNHPFEQISHLEQNAEDCKPGMEDTVVGSSHHNSRWIAGERINTEISSASQRESSHLGMDLNKKYHNLISNGFGAKGFQQGSQILKTTGGFHNLSSIEEFTIRQASRNRPETNYQNYNPNLNLNFYHVGNHGDSKSKRVASEYIKNQGPHWTYDNLLSQDSRLSPILNVQSVKSSEDDPDCKITVKNYKYNGDNRQSNYGAVHDTNKEHLSMQSEAPLVNGYQTFDRCASTSEFQNIKSNSFKSSYEEDTNKSIKNRTLDNIERFNATIDKLKRNIRNIEKLDMNSKITVHEETPTNINGALAKTEEQPVLQKVNLNENLNVNDSVGRVKKNEEYCNENSVQTSKKMPPLSKSAFKKLSQRISYECTQEHHSHSKQRQVVSLEKIEDTEPPREAEGDGEFTYSTHYGMRLKDAISQSKRSLKTVHFASEKQTERIESQEEDKKDSQFQIDSKNKGEIVDTQIQSLKNKGQAIDVIESKDFNEEELEEFVRKIRQEDRFADSGQSNSKRTVHGRNVSIQCEEKQELSAEKATNSQDQPLTQTLTKSPQRSKDPTSSINSSKSNDPVYYAEGLKGQQSHPIEPFSGTEQPQDNQKPKGVQKGSSDQQKCLLKIESEEFSNSLLSSEQTKPNETVKTPTKKQIQQNNYEAAMQYEVLYSRTIPEDDNESFENYQESEGSFFGEEHINRSRTKLSSNSHRHSENAVSSSGHQQVVQKQLFADEQTNNQQTASVNGTSEPNDGTKNIQQSQNLQQVQNTQQSYQDQINAQRQQMPLQKKARDRHSSVLGEYVEQNYENGGQYYGYKLNGQRHGKGRFFYRDGGYYTGDWKNNMMSGYGKLYYDNGALAYDGQWYQDEFHGKGKVFNDSAEEFPVIEKSGTDVIRGHFNYANFNQDIERYWVFYDGELSHDTKVGFGKIMLSNGEYYIGEFRNDKTHGKGKFYSKKNCSKKRSVEGHEHQQQIEYTMVRGIWNEGFLLKVIEEVDIYRSNGGISCQGDNNGQKTQTAGDQQNEGEIEEGPRAEAQQNEQLQQQKQTALFEQQPSNQVNLQAHNGDILVPQSENKKRPDSF